MVNCYFCEVDVEDYFTFDRLKVVKVRDKWLGLMKFLILTPLLCYILYYQLIQDRRYLIYEMPSGSVTVNINKPLWYPGGSTNKMLNFQDQYYCTQYTGSEPSTNPMTSTNPSAKNFRLPCVQADEHDIRYQDDINTVDVDISTRVTYKFQTYGCSVGSTTCANTWTTSPPSVLFVPGQPVPTMFGSALASIPAACMAANVGNTQICCAPPYGTGTYPCSSSYFLNGIEDFTISLSHYAAALNTEMAYVRDKAYYYQSSMGNGVAVDSAGKIVRTFKGGDSGSSADDMTLWEMLQLANVTLSDATGLQPGESTGPAYVNGSTTDYDIRRNSGTLIFFLLKYSNLGSNAPVSFKLSGQVMNGVPVVNRQVVYFDMNNRVIVERGTVKMIFLAKGILGVFDFTSLIVQMTIVYGITVLVTFLCDIVVFYILPLQRLYRAMVTEQLSDFKTVTAKVEAIARREDGGMLTDLQSVHLAKDLTRAQETVSVVTPAEVELTNVGAYNKQKAEMTRLRLIRNIRPKAGEAGEMENIVVEESEIDAMFKYIVDDSGNPWADKDGLDKLLKDLDVPIPDRDRFDGLVRQLQQSVDDVKKDVEKSKKDKELAALKKEKEKRRKKASKQMTKEEINEEDEQDKKEEQERKEKEDKERAEALKNGADEKKSRVMVIDEASFKLLIKAHYLPFKTRARIQIMMYVKENAIEVEEEKEKYDRDFTEYAASNVSKKKKSKMDADVEDHMTLEQVSIYLSTLRVGGRNIITTNEERQAILSEFQVDGKINFENFHSIILLLQSSFAKIYGIGKEKSDLELKKQEDDKKAEEEKKKAEKAEEEKKASKDKDKGKGKDKDKGKKEEKKEESSKDKLALFVGETVKVQKLTWKDLPSEYEQISSKVKDAYLELQYAKRTFKKMQVKYWPTMDEEDPSKLGDTSNSIRTCKLQ